MCYQWYIEDSRRLLTYCLRVQQDNEWTIWWLFWKSWTSRELAWIQRGKNSHSCQLSRARISIQGDREWTKVGVVLWDRRRNIGHIRSIGILRSTYRYQGLLDKRSHKMGSGEVRGYLVVLAKGSCIQTWSCFKDQKGSQSQNDKEQC